MNQEEKLTPEEALKWHRRLSNHHEILAEEARVAKQEAKAEWHSRLATWLCDEARATRRALTAAQERSDKGARDNEV